MITQSQILSLILWIYPEMDSQTLQKKNSRPDTFYSSVGRHAGVTPVGYAGFCPQLLCFSHTLACFSLSLKSAFVKLRAYQ